METFKKNKLALALLGLSFSSGAFALEYNINQLSQIQVLNPFAIDLNDSGQVAWVQRESFEAGHPIMFWDGSAASQVATTKFDTIEVLTRLIAMNNAGKVVWLDTNTPYPGYFITPDQVMAWDGVQTSTLSSQVSPKGGLSDVNEAGQVSWYDGNESQFGRVLLSDGVTETVITDDLNGFRSGYNIQLNDAGQVVFGSSLYDPTTFNFNRTIKMWNGNALIDLDTIAGFDKWIGYEPQINEQGDVLWGVNQYPNATIRLWDGVQTQDIAQLTDVFDARCFDINNEGQAVWIADGPNGSFVQHWDGSAVTTIAPGSCATINDAGHIAWSAVEDNYSNVVYATDGTDIIQLGSGSEKPVLNENGDVAWATGNGVYLASIVKPLTPVEAVQALIESVAQLNARAGIVNSLDAKLSTATGVLDDVNSQNDIAAINTLSAFIAAVQAQSTTQIDTADADKLIADAEAIIAQLTAG
ncbi:hypothetical protein ACFL2V_03960 [Pseudomonadota bacterium]